jgi:hypothetical protein
MTRCTDGCGITSDSYTLWPRRSQRTNQWLSIRAARSAGGARRSKKKKVPTPPGRRIPRVLMPVAFFQEPGAGSG